MPIGQRGCHTLEGDAHFWQLVEEKNCHQNAEDVWLVDVLNQHLPGASMHTDRTNSTS